VCSVALLSACGSNKNAGSSDFSSRAPITTTTSSTKPIATCSKGSGNMINVKMKVFTDPSTNTTRMDFVFAKLTSLPTNFQNSTNYISMWKWLANSNGSTYLDSSALQFILIDSTNGQYITNWMTTLRWSDIATLASSMGITDAQTFFNRVNILVDLKDVSGSYDVLKITSYDSTTNQAVSQTDGLLPPYYANPADYAIEPEGTPRAQVLQNLHPFAGSTQYTADQFKAMFNDFCF
ncbi:MAG: hypothetical protein ACXVCA_11910, partial [Bdellovibrio sp.]